MPQIRISKPQIISGRTGISALISFMKLASLQEKFINKIQRSALTYINCDGARCRATLFGGGATIGHAVVQFFNSPKRYGVVAQCLHWGAVALVLLAWTLGVLGDEFPEGSSRTLA